MLLTSVLLFQTVAPTPRPLGRSDATLSHEFVRVFSLAERPDGRVVLVDRGDELLAVADFGRGTVTRIGRTGGGPEEYRFPGRLVPMSGDSLMAADDGNNRLAVLGPDLRIHRTANGRAPGLPAELSPRAVDSKGRFYAVIPAWMSVAQGTIPDSLPIVRFTPGTGPVETIAPIRVTPKDRTDFVRRSLATSGTSGKGGPGRPPGGLSPMSAKEMTDQAVGELVANMTFAATKPAFTDAAPIIAPDGTLWVERSAPAGAASTWDVFDGGGRPSASWQLPLGRRLVGLGRGRVYLVAGDENGIERLERYPLPAGR